MNQTQAMTLRGLKPRKTNYQKASNIILGLLAVVVLMASYRFVGIDPMKFIEKGRMLSPTSSVGNSLTSTATMPGSRQIIC